MNDKIINAKITGTFLGREDHDIPTFGIYVQTAEGWCTTIGYYSLSGYDRESEKYDWCNFEIIFKILKIVGVNSWEELTEQYIRIKVPERRNAPIIEFGNLVEDEWININEWFEQENKK